ncbi:gliding motility-associated C-terminal domain-containing protein [Pedobacter nyackensis]|uniref:gliding motility-associated C-terminal domain-containing protein n=1 Tax=Pedobacter nyackensis TaxID=475255 RepID=UPI002930397A|nr:gliding motility-associated C-terminal domain-containing protein [Pedobacter nyackensis]
MLTLLTVGASYGQGISAEVINAAGNSHTQNNITYEWSVGEMTVVETMENSRLSLTNGFLQPVVIGFFNNNVYKVFPINILTPNGDGINDTWVIKDIEKYPDNEITIFDRSGRTIHHVINYQNDWMGYLKGKPLEEGTYYYIIKLRKNNKADHIKGFITIVN